MITSYIVTNAISTPEEIQGSEMVHKEFFVNFKQQLATILLQVVVNNKILLVTVAGGEVNPDKSVNLTPIGELAVFNALKFLSPSNKVVMNSITCKDGNLTYKVMNPLKAAESGDLVVFVGDMSVSCDGKILPLLNVQQNKAVTLKVIK